MSEMSEIQDFFRSGTFNISGSFLKNNQIIYERLYFDAYAQLINEYKRNVHLVIPENRSIKSSSWEPMLRSIHNGMVLTLRNYLPVINNKTESSILMDLFDILKLAGFGTYQLGLPEKGAMMTIGVNHTIDSYSDLQLNMEPEKSFSAFTAGIVLACFNLAMTSLKAPEITPQKTNEIYLGSPDIVQVNADSIDSEVLFSVVIR